MRSPIQLTTKLGKKWVIIHACAVKKYFLPMLIFYQVLYIIIFQLQFIAAYYCYCILSSFLKEALYLVEKLVWFEQQSCGNCLTLLKQRFISPLTYELSLPRINIKVVQDSHNYVLVLQTISIFFRYRLTAQIIIFFNFVVGHLIAHLIKYSLKNMW